MGTPQGLSPGGIAHNAEPAPRHRRAHPVRPDLSDDQITPENPPDAKDGFKLLVEGATEYAVYALSPAGVVCTWNRGAERMKGYQSEEVIGQHFSMFFPEQDREAGVPAKLLDSALADGKALSEGWQVRKDSTRLWASVVVTPLYDEVGRVRGFGKLIRDDTDRRANYSRTVRQEEQERIADSLADTVVRSLFAMSLHANGAMTLITNPEARRRIEQVVREADEAIRTLRTAIFKANTQPIDRPTPLDEGA